MSCTIYNYISASHIIDLHSIAHRAFIQQGPEHASVSKALTFLRVLNTFNKPYTFATCVMQPLTVPQQVERLFLKFQNV